MMPPVLFKGNLFRTFTFYLSILTQCNHKMDLICHYIAKMRGILACGSQAMVTNPELIWILFDFHSPRWRLPEEQAALPA